MKQGCRANSESPTSFAKTALMTSEKVDGKRKEDLEQNSKTLDLYEDTKWEDISSDEEFDILKLPMMPELKDKQNISTTFEQNDTVMENDNSMNKNQLLESETYHG